MSAQSDFDSFSQCAESMAPILHNVRMACWIAWKERPPRTIRRTDLLRAVAVVEDYVLQCHELLPSILNQYERWKTNLSEIYEADPTKIIRFGAVTGQSAHEVSILLAREFCSTIWLTLDPIGHKMANLDHPGFPIKKLKTDGNEQMSCELVSILAKVPDYDARHLEILIRRERAVISQQLDRAKLGLVFNEKAKTVSRRVNSAEKTVELSILEWHTFRVFYQAGEEGASISRWQSGYPGEWDARHASMSILRSKLETLGITIPARSRRIVDLLDVTIS